MGVRGHAEVGKQREGRGRAYIRRRKSGGEIRGIKVEGEVPIWNTRLTDSTSATSSAWLPMFSCTEARAAGSSSGEWAVDGGTGSGRLRGEGTQGKSVRTQRLEGRRKRCATRRSRDIPTHTSSQKGNYTLYSLFCSVQRLGPTVGCMKDHFVASGFSEELVVRYDRCLRQIGGRDERSRCREMYLACMCTWSDRDRLRVLRHSIIMTTEGTRTRSAQSFGKIHSRSTIVT